MPPFPSATIGASTAGLQKTGVPVRKDRRAGLVVRVVLTCLGAAMVIVAAATDHRWTARHMLPDLIVALPYRMLMFDVERALLALAGGALMFLLAPRAERVVVRNGIAASVGRVGGIAIALSIAALASEGAMRWITWRQDRPWRIDREPLRRGNALYGWENVGSRAVRDTFYTPPIRYAVDAGGHRVRDLAHPVDHRRPTILFIGESIMFGAGLNWDDTIPGRVQAATGVQSANLAVNGFATDQAHLRLRAELPRFAHPVAVVAIFGPSLMERNLRHNKPWLDAGLRWHPTESEWRLHHLFRFLVPIHRASTIHDAATTARSVLRADQATARARGARLIVLIPTFLPEGADESALRREVFAGADIMPVQVRLDPAWRIPTDYHPDARADRVMVAAIVARLSGRSATASQGFTP